jgi:hypothetical protein
MPPESARAQNERFAAFAAKGTIVGSCRPGEQQAGRAPSGSARTWLFDAGKSPGSDTATDRQFPQIVGRPDLNRNQTHGNA